MAEKFTMKCDLCGVGYEYSEDVIHHYTVIYEGELRPHTHVCLNCESLYGLKPKIIEKKAPGKLSNAEAARIIVKEGIGYAVRSYISASEFSDPLTAKLWGDARNVLDLLEEHLRDEIVEIDECY
jgi:hypothetical protein